MAQAADMAALLQSIDQPKDAGPGLKTKPIAYLGERWGDAARCLLIGVDITEGYKLARGHSNAPADRKGEVSRDDSWGRCGRGVIAALDGSALSSPNSRIPPRGIRLLDHFQQQMQHRVNPPAHISQH